MLSLENSEEILDIFEDKIKTQSQNLKEKKLWDNYIIKSKEFLIYQYNDYTDMINNMQKIIDQFSLKK